MPTEVCLVSAGAGSEGCSISEWYVADGATVLEGESLYSLESDKVNIDVEAEVSGILKQLVPAGQASDPGAVVAHIYAEDEKIPASAPAPAVEEVQSEAPSNSGSLVASAVSVAADQESAVDRIRSTPAARKLAREQGVDYTTIKGSGPRGRVIKSDVMRAVSEQETSASVSSTYQPVANATSRVNTSPATAPAVTSDEASGQKIPLTNMRRTIARRMSESLQNTAQLTMTMEVRAGELIKLRGLLLDEWQEEGIRPSFTDLIIKAVAKALAKHPMMNSQWRDDHIWISPSANIGMAVSLQDGLVVPVLRDVNQLTVGQVAMESKRLASYARNGTLAPDAFGGGTFTVSTLGMYGVDSFTPILNEPQAGILGVNRIYDGVEWEGETPVKAKKMNLSLTWDHRVLDGAPAAEFLQSVVRLLENPLRLLV